jgi:hypothetical protein
VFAFSRPSMPAADKLDFRGRQPRNSWELNAMIMDGEPLKAQFAQRACEALDTALHVAGFTPGLSELADVASGLVAASRGDVRTVAITVLAVALPIVGAAQIRAAMHARTRAASAASYKWKPGAWWPEQWVRPTAWPVNPVPTHWRGKTVGDSLTEYQSRYGLPSDLRAHDILGHRNGALPNEFRAVDPAAGIFDDTDMNDMTSFAIMRGHDPMTMIRARIGTPPDWVPGVVREHISYLELQATANRLSPQAYVKAIWNGSGDDFIAAPYRAPTSYSLGN